MLRLKSYHDEIKAQNDLLDRKVKERTVDLEAARLDLIWRLGRAAEYRDTDTGNHVIRVGYYCRALADKLGMDLEFRKGIFLTSPLHDIGKIGVPDNILLKQGKLTSDEWRIMRRHCEIGADILRQDPVRWSKVEMCHDLLGLTETVKSDNPFLKMAKTIALTHHERWDGYGYPFGLSEGEIPLESRIVTVADVYDALYSKRPYKPGYTDSKVLEIMRENNGIQFDPGVFACFEKSLDLFDDIRSQFSDQQDGISTEWQDEYRHLLWQVKK
jgi:putative two-component system response regulator